MKKQKNAQPEKPAYEQKRDKEYKVINGKVKRLRLEKGKVYNMTQVCV